MAIVERIIRGKKGKSSFRSLRFITPFSPYVNICVYINVRASKLRLIDILNEQNSCISLHCSECRGRGNGGRIFQSLVPTVVRVYDIYQKQLNKLRFIHCAPPCSCISCFVVPSTSVPSKYLSARNASRQNNF